jgi:hypothetical protein
MKKLVGPGSTGIGRTIGKPSLPTINLALGVVGKVARFELDTPSKAWRDCEFDSSRFSPFFTCNSGLCQSPEQVLRHSLQ